MSESILPHKHLLVNAETTDLREHLSPNDLTNHIYRLAELIQARIVIEPQVKYCDSPGNTGLIGIAGIGTSHITCHHWDNTNPQRLQLDIYSCTEYDEMKALSEIRRFWKISRGRYWLIRRSAALEFDVERQGFI